MIINIFFPLFFLFFFFFFFFFFNYKNRLKKQTDMVVPLSPTEYAVLIPFSLSPPFSLPPLPPFKLNYHNTSYHTHQKNIQTNKPTNQQNNKTTKQQNNKTTKQQNNNKITTKDFGNRTQELCWNFGLCCY